MVSKGQWSPHGSCSEMCIRDSRNISKWVKISTPSIYKKVIQLEEKGYITSTTIKEGKMPEKAVYTLTRCV